jgi:hypothetical protein
MIFCHSFYSPYRKPKIKTLISEQVAPKYTPEIYEDAGKALATSILDLTESNPWTRLTW